MYETDGPFGKSRLGYVPDAPCLNGLVDYVTRSGWHRCNDLYVIHRANMHSNETLLMLTMGGAGELMVGGKRYSLYPGTISLVPLWMEHAYYTQPGHVWEFYWVHTSGANASRIESHIIRTLGHAFPPQDFQTLLQCFHHIVNTSLRKAEYELFTFGKIQEILRILLEGTLCEPDMWDKGALVSRVVEYLENHYTERLRLKEIAQVMSVTQEHMIRTFKRVMGTTPYQYVEQLRLEDARMRLILSEAPISQIAREVGFSSASAFSSRFREAFGVLPINYRNAHLRRNTND